MGRMWTVAAVAIAVIGVGALVACDANGKDALRTAASVAVPTAAAQEKGCSLIGSWMTTPGSSYVQWNGTLGGQSNSSGTVVADVPVWPKTDVINWVAHVTLRGTWERTGGNTFAFTQKGWIPGPDGTPLFIAKNIGTETLSDDCNTLTIVSKMQAFLLTGELVSEQDLPPMVAYRTVVEGE